MRPYANPFSCISSIHKVAYNLKDSGAAYWLDVPRAARFARGRARNGPSSGARLSWAEIIFNYLPQAIEIIRRFL
jgi:hypothetical protein